MVTLAHIDGVHHDKKLDIVVTPLPCNSTLPHGPREVTLRDNTRL